MKFTNKINIINNINLIFFFFIFIIGIEIKGESSIFKIKRTLTKSSQIISKDKKVILSTPLFPLQC
jgi:hypothetical protein